MANSEICGEQRSPRAAHGFAPSITSAFLYAALCAVLFGGTATAFAADNVTWTPYAGTPNVNATFQAYPGGQSADNMIVLTVTGPDHLEGTEFGQHLSITGANAAQFQEDTNVFPSCSATLGAGNGAAPPYTCALPIYFNAPTTPGSYTATLTYNFIDATTGSPGNQSITLTGTVLAVPAPSGNASLAFLPVTTIFAGTGGVGYSGNNGPAIDAELNDPSDVAIDSQGNVYIADSGNYVVRKVDTTGKITVFAGTPQKGGYSYGYSGEGGPATSATLMGPVALTFDKAGNLYFADGLYAVRKVNAVTGAITTYAGSTSFEYGYSGDGGLATSALLYAPSSLAFDLKGNLYIAEIDTNDIRMVNTSGIISTYAGQSSYYNQVAGHTPYFPGFSGDGGPASSATLFRPYSLAMGTSGNSLLGAVSILYIADGENNRVRVVDTDTGIITTEAGLGAFSTGTPASIGAVDLPAATAEIYPQAVAVDPAGNFYLANFDGLLFRTDSATGLMTQFPSASTTTLYGGGGSTAGMKFASTGSMYIAPQNLNTVTEVSAQGSLNFGSVDVGDTSSPQFLTLQNNGSGPMTFDATPYIVAGNYGVGDTGTCSFTSPLAVGASCTVAVTFSPQGPGPLTGTVSFASNDPNSPLVAQLSGIGVGAALPVAVLSPTTLSFPATDVGAQSTLSTQLSNTGVSVLNISDILIETNPADFAVDLSTTCGSTLAAGATCTITVDFRPVAGASYSSILSVADNAAGSPQTANLTGTGVLIANLSINETIHVTDAPTSYLPILLNIAETIHVTDTLTSIAPATQLSINEQIHVSDAITAVPSQITPTILWATPAAIPYGTALSATQLHASSTVAGTFAYSPPIGAVLAAGTHTLSVLFTPTNMTDYTTASGSVTLTVNPALLTVTAVNISKIVGTANPAFSASYSGFVNGDTTAVLGGLPALSTAATTSSPIGTYPITAAQGTLTAANYTFTFVPGTLNVVAAPTIVLTTSAPLSGSASAGYTATVKVTNNGTGAASNVTLTGATLGSVSGTPLPQTLGTLAAGGGFATVTVNFPASAGANGAAVVEKITGSYIGGTFSASVHATLP
jgi:type IV secretory pathway protease TraF